MSNLSVTIRYRRKRITKMLVRNSSSVNQVLLMHCVMQVGNSICLAFRTFHLGLEHNFSKSTRYQALLCSACDNFYKRTARDSAIATILCSDCSPLKSK